MKGDCCRWCEFVWRVAEKVAKRVGFNLSEAEADEKVDHEFLFYRETESERHILALNFSEDRWEIKKQFERSEQWFSRSKVLGSGKISEIDKEAYESYWEAMEVMEKLEKAFIGMEFVAEDNEEGKEEVDKLVLERLRKVFHDVSEGELDWDGDAGTCFVRVRGFDIFFDCEPEEGDEDVTLWSYDFYGVQKSWSSCLKFFRKKGLEPRSAFKVEIITDENKEVKP